MSVALAQEQIIEEQESERLRSFDVLASIDMFRFDLQRHDVVLPETRQRVCDEELSYIAEGINRPLSTEFVLEERGGELAYFDDGEWRPYVSTLVTGLKVAEKEAQADPRKAFLAERAAEDLRIGYRLLALKRGEQMSWDSPFPEEPCRLYGEKFIGSLGFQSARRMGFLYHAGRNADGSLTLQSQSVDASDEEAFAAARKQISAEAMLAAYDQTLERKHGGEFYAGRPVNYAAPEENAWHAIKRHGDLITRYLDRIEVLAGQMQVSRTELEVAKKRLTYGVWAALKRRLDKEALTPNGVASEPITQTAKLDQEMHFAYREAMLSGAVLFGCGGSTSPEEAILNASAQEVFDLLFGKRPQGGSEISVPGVMFCVNCPKCRMYHHEVRAVGGKYSCRNKKCGYTASA